MLSAGVLVRKTHLELEHCTFSGDQSDDALHLRRSSFAFSDIEIIDSAGDALAGYFARGSIDGGKIARAGRNGIHVAGSRVSVRDFKIEDVRDEALSATKDSLVEADALDIERVGIAFAATGAVGEIRNSRIRDVVRVAFLAYVKDREFGPGKLRAQGNRVEGAALVAVAQHGSEVVVDGESVPTVDVDLESLSRRGTGT